MADTIHEEPELRQKLLQLHKQMADTLNATYQQVANTIYPQVFGGWGRSDEPGATPAAREFASFMQRYYQWSYQGQQAMEQILQQLWTDGISLSEADQYGSGGNQTNGANVPTHHGMNPF